MGKTIQSGVKPPHSKKGMPNKEIFFMGLSSWSRWCGGVLLAAGILSSGALHSQLLPADGSEKLAADYTKARRDLFAKMAKGEVTPDGTPEQQKTLDIVAKWNTYRFTWPEHQNKADGINRLFVEYETDLGQIERNKSDTRQQFVDAFAKHMIVHAKEVLKNDKPGPRVNAARALSRLGRFGAEEVGDALAEIVKDPEQNDGARYWAFNGLRDLFTAGHGPTPILMRDKAREARCILTLINWLESKPTLASDAPAEELEGFRVLRREAVKALAMTRYPAVVDAKKALVGRTAQVLLRVARRDGFVPEPRVDEMVEAAIGVARLQYKLYENYQPDYAAHQLAGFVVDFADKYGEISGERGWKVQAARLNDAFNAMRADTTRNVRDRAVGQYVTDALGRSGKMLQLIETKGAANPTDLRAWVGSTPAKAETLYKGVADSKIKPPMAADAEK